MSGRVHRQQQKIAGQVAQHHTKMLAPAVKYAYEMAKTAMGNEIITRSRVERMEALLSQGFWARLKWAVFGWTPTNVEHLEPEPEPELPEES